MPYIMQSSIRISECVCVCVCEREREREGERERDDKDFPMRKKMTE